MHQRRQKYTAACWLLTDVASTARGTVAATTLIATQTFSLPAPFRPLAPLSLRGRGPELTLPPTNYSADQRIHRRADTGLRVGA